MQIAVPMTHLTDYNGVDRLVKIINSFNAIVKNIAGKIGLILISPITLSLVGILYYKVKKNCREVSRFLQKLRLDASRMTDRQKMETHLLLEQWISENNPHINYIRRRAGMYGKRFFLGKTISMLNDTHQEMEDAEAFFKAAAYPNLNRKFSSEEMDELFHAFEGSGHDFTDWEDSNSDLQKPHYID